MMSGEGAMPCLCTSWTTAVAGAVSIQLQGLMSVKLNKYDHETSNTMSAAMKAILRSYEEFLTNTHDYT